MFKLNFPEYVQNCQSESNVFHRWSAFWKDIY